MKTVSALGQPTEKTVVDFIVSGEVKGDIIPNTENGKTAIVQTVVTTMVFHVRYVLDLRPCEKRCLGPLIFTDKELQSDPVFDNYPIKTDDYLIPILRPSDYPMVAKCLLDMYFPERNHRIGNTSFDGEELAKRMGFTVCDVCFADKNIMGQIYYDLEKVAVVDDCGVKKFMNVRPGIILVSKEHCRNKAVRNSTIVHECCHMFLDRWFFLLQLMVGKPYAAYTNRLKVGNTVRHQKRDPLDWMEYQCEKLPAYILMEEDSVYSFVEDRIFQYSEMQPIAKMSRIINEVSVHYQISKAMAKYRLIELGYQDAEGINCFADGVRIPDHACCGRWQKGITYTLSSEEASQQAFQNSEILSKLICGEIIYAEGHFCVNSKKYLNLYSNGAITLSIYAREHIDECCYGFSVSGNRIEGWYQFGVASRGKTKTNTDQTDIAKPVQGRFRSVYTLSAEPGTDKYNEENSIFAKDSCYWGKLLNALPNDLTEAVQMVLQMRGVTQEAVANELLINRKSLYNKLNSDEVRISCIVGICIYLKLPYFVSERLLTLSGNCLRNIDEHNLYRAFLAQTGMLTVDRCNDILESEGYLKLAHTKTEKNN